MRTGPLAQFRSHAPSQNGHHDPFNSLRGDLGDIWQQFFDFTRQVEPDAFSPSLDINETAKEVIIKADLPGLTEDQIDLEIVGDVLSLKGERSEERKDETESRRIVERSWGRFERSLRLPFVPGEKDLSTSFANGVLTINVKKPKSLETARRKIPIGKAS
ncbi:Hsp20/alpha crystallin family protein [Hyphomonas sp.]|uniref:Hsp20/alpha crystallin family protein n=1 Tax=Hyphomonas sp. TaxID=87 RepID=UPI001D3E2D4C|nr:Hsp20/alpha crystallin family protein [Hyphomonas sp.]MBU3921940.1 Hsp20/alpha crystallin family protein [Alphaproteobacteria bacterium]MBU4063674.1 Hsp20/alpha crystallin family protein [Alphaproteobacteria bacterium]MBU4164365.1 Hsp20/alpha crystallin family protein [Alphaproteobacteria bacterium]